MYTGVLTCPICGGKKFSVSDDVSYGLIPYSSKVRPNLDTMFRTELRFCDNCSYAIQFKS